MRISDWSSDVCSSDLYPLGVRDRNPGDPWKIVGERPQAIGACEQADEDEPDDRVDAKPVERGNDKHRAAEHNQSFTKAGVVDRPGQWRSEERGVREECVRTFRYRWERTS